MTDTEVRDVRLERIPVPLWNQTRTWFLGLLREFDVLASSEPASATPTQLLEFVADAREKFSRFTQTDVVLEEALARGDTHLDLDLRLPESAAPTARELRSLIDRAEEYCRSGEMLTLMPTAEMRRFTHWYLDEVVDQLEGGEPTPWDEGSGE